MRDQATINYLSAEVPNPFFGLMPVDGRAPASAARPSRASGCCGRIRSSTPSTPRPTKASRGTTRCRLACRGASPAGYTLGANYTFSRFTRGDRVPERRPIRSRAKVISSQDVPHRLTRQRHLGSCRSAAAAASATNAAARSTRSSAAGRSRASTRYQSGFPIGFGNILFTGDLDDIALPASERIGRALVQHRCRVQQGAGAAARVQRAHVPAAASTRSAPTPSTTSICRSSRTRRSARQEAAVPVRGAQRVQPPAVPRPEHGCPTAVGVRDDQRVDAAELRRAGPR